MKKRFLLLLFLFLLVGCEEQVNENCQSTSNGRGKILSVLPLGTISSSYLSNFLNDNTKEYLRKGRFHANSYFKVNYKLLIK